MAKTAVTSPGPVEVFSDDPMIRALSNFVKGLHHFNDRQLTLRHLKILIVVKMAVELTGSPEVTIANICHLAHLKESEFSVELNDLCERRYLFCHLPTFGDKMVYGVGAMGAIALRPILKGLDQNQRKTS